MTTSQLKYLLVNSMFANENNDKVYYINFTQGWSSAKEILDLANDCLPDKKFSFSLPGEQVLEELKKRINQVIDGEMVFDVTGKDYPFNELPVTVKFSNDNGIPRLQISAVLEKNDIRLSDNLPLFYSTLADRLSLQSAMFKLDSDQSSEQSFGLFYIHMKLDLDKTMSGFNSLLNLPHILDIYGPCWLENGGSEFYGMRIFADLPDPPNKPQLSLPGFKITLEEFGIIDEPIYSFVYDEYFSYSFITLEASLKLDGIDLSFPVGVEIANLETDIHFKADLNNLKDFGIKGLESLLQIKENSFSDKVPAVVNIIKGIQFEKFGFYFNPGRKDNKLTSVYGGVLFVEEKFDEITREKKIENASTSLDLSAHFSKKNEVIVARLKGFHFETEGLSKIRELILTGEVQVGENGFIEIQLLKQGAIGYGIAGWLKEKSRIQLAEIVQLFTNENIELPDLSIDKLDFNFTTGDSMSWSFDINLIGYLPIPFNKPVFSIRQVYFSVVYSDNVQLSLGGIFSIGRVDCYISGLYDRERGGWLCSAGTGANQEIPVGKLLEDLWKDLLPDNSAHKIPDSIASLVAENIEIKLDTTNGFAFSAAVDISESKTFDQQGGTMPRDAGRPLIMSGDPDIKLKNIRLKIERNNSIKFSAEASFSIGLEEKQDEKEQRQLEFVVDASYDDGWDFKAAMTGTITLADLVSYFAKGTSLPSSLDKFKFSGLYLSFNTKSGDKHFSGKGEFPLGNQSSQLSLKIDITHSADGKPQAYYSGHLDIGGKFIFDVIFKKDENDKIFLGSYHQEKNAGEIEIHELLTGMDVPNPPQMSISLKDAFFVHGEKKEQKSFNLFVADVGTSLDLSNLPLINKVLPANTTLSLALRVLYANNDFGFEVNNINSILPDGIPRLSENKSLKQGHLTLISDIRVGDQVINLQLPISLQTNEKQNTIGEKATNENSKSLDTPTVANDGITWFSIGKKFGPVIFNRIGLTYKSPLLFVYPDAALSVGGLTLSLQGLSVNTPITKFNPSFDLKGLGIDFKKGPLEIGASFLRRQIKTPQGETIDEYDGMAILKFNDLSISALGSYCYFENQPSLFIFAYLNQALGGPAFFFVEGLAAAFGYNRSLLMPTVDTVSKFPLVRQVMETQDPNDSGTSLSVQLEAINKYIPPSAGDMFFAIGVKFNSFKLIDSFAMLAISFGHHLEIDVLGQSNIIVPSEIPPGVSPLAEIKIQLLAKFLPEEGFLAVMAELTDDSYIFSKNCHLTGGAAFYCWFKGDHQGDFVVTMGGYHSAFKPPSHYPSVPRLGLNWQVSESLSIKGDMYFALCPHTFMAGGHLEALYNDGPLQAWFKAGVDFLVSWQPYHYDARLYLDIGVSYTYDLFGTQHITVDLGADVHIWGPEFSGNAVMHLWIMDIAVVFGAQNLSAPQPLSWADFQIKCLPAAEKIISSSVTRGKHGEDENKTPIVNAKELTIAINSAIPVTFFILPWERKPGSSFGVAPMNVSKISSSIQTITITKNKKELTDSEKQNFNFDLLYQAMPSAIWGTQFPPDLNTDQKTIKLATGLKITTIEPPSTPGLNAGGNIKKIPGYNVAAIDLQESFKMDKWITGSDKDITDNLKNLLEDIQLGKIKTGHFDLK